MLKADPEYERLQTRGRVCKYLKPGSGRTENQCGHHKRPRKWQTAHSLPSKLLLSRRRLAISELVSSPQERQPGVDGLMAVQFDVGVWRFHETRLALCVTGQRDMDSIGAADLCVNRRPHPFLPVLTLKKLERSPRCRLSALEMS